jgi:uncharacterized membrane protein
MMGMPFLVGFIFCITGMITYIIPPKKINHFYGYRTRSSMKSQEVWDFSQRFSSIKMIQSGLILIVVSGLKLFVNFSIEGELIVSLIALVLVIIFLFISVERAIKKKFSNQE